MKKVPKASEVAELRRRAEAWLMKSKKQVEAELSECKKVETHRPEAMDEARRLVHELQVQQIVLEMQNDELLRTRGDLEALSRQYADLYESAPVGYLSLGRNGAIRRANLAGARLLGQESARLAKRCFGPFVSPASRPVFNAFFEKVFQSLAPETCDVEILTKGRDPVWVRIEATATEDRQSCRAVLIDITEGKRAKDDLLLSEAKLSNALRIAHAGHWEYDFGSDTFTFNDNFYQIFGTTAKEAGGYTMSSAEYARRFCHPDDAVQVGREVQASIETKDPGYNRYFEHRIIYADGEIGYMAVRFFIAKDSRGRTTKSFGVNYDITERKKAEAAILESVEKFQTITENSFDLMTLYDTESKRIVWANKRWMSVLGWSPETAEDPLSLIHPEDRGRVQEALAEVEKNDAHFVQGLEFRYIDTKGNYRFFDSSVRRLTIGGKQVYFTGAHDITESKRADEMLREQLAELKRWHDVTEGREMRVLDLKREVNELLRQAGRPLRYTSPEPEKP
jgi:PAS domain S-box-containing protein